MELLQVFQPPLAGPLEFGFEGLFPWGTSVRSRAKASERDGSHSPEGFGVCNAQLASELDVHCVHEVDVRSMKLFLQH